MDWLPRYLESIIVLDSSFPILDHSGSFYYSCHHFIHPGLIHGHHMLLMTQHFQNPNIDHQCCSAILDSGLLHFTYKLHFSSNFPLEVWITLFACCLAFLEYFLSPSEKIFDDVSVVMSLVIFLHKHSFPPREKILLSQKG